MTTRTVDFGGRGLPDLPAEQEVAWRQWLARHGLPDPDDIPFGARLVCDDDARTVTIPRWIRDDNGKMIVDWKRNEVLREWITVQLEAPALPIPPGYEVTVD